MTEFLFPDTTVLCSFAAVGRLDLLKTVLNGRGRWTEAAVVDGQIRAEEGFRLMHTMVERGRCLRLPRSADELRR